MTRISRTARSAGNSAPPCSRCGDPATERYWRTMLCVDCFDVAIELEMEADGIDTAEANDGAAGIDRDG